MSDQPRKRSPWRLSLIVFVGVVVFYFFLARPAEPVHDLTVNEDLAYLALGRAGMVIVDVSAAEEADQVGSFDTLGIANAVAVEGNYAYIADGREGLRIIDVSTPQSPREISAHDTPGYASDVDVAKSIAYLADGKSGLIIINIEDQSFPARLSTFLTNNLVQTVAVRGKYAYLGDNKNNLQVVNISNPKKPEEVAILDVGAEIEDMDIQTNRAYLATGEQGMVVVDITNPEQPAILNSVDTPGNVQDVAVNGNTIAFLADGRNGLLVYDISDLNAVEAVGSFTNVLNANQVELSGNGLYLSDKDSALYVVDADLDFTTRRITSTEKQQGRAQAVAVGERFAYLAYADQGLRVIDITNSAAPWETSVYDSPGEAIGVTLSGDFIYLADGTSGMRVLFLESPDSANPQVAEVAVVDTPGEASNVAVVAQTAYLADGSGGMRVISMVNPGQPETLGWEDTPGSAMDVAVLGDYAYVADGISGLQIINVLDETIPTRVGAYDTPGEARAVVVSRTVEPDARTLVYIADGEGGLRVIDATDPLIPIEIGSFTAYETVLDVFISGSNAYLSTGSLGMRIVDITDPANLIEVGFSDTPGQALGLDLLGQKTYVADDTRGLRILDVSDPVGPIEVGFYDVPRIVRGVVIDGNYAYLTNLESGFRIADISDPRRIRQVGHYDQGGIVEDIAIQEGVAYLADANGLQSVDVQDQKNPTSLGSLDFPGRSTSVFVVKDVAYVTENEFGLRIADIQEPTTIQPISSMPTVGSPQDVYVAGNYAYIAVGAAGLQIVNVANPQDPKTASVIDQFQDANSVIVRGEYAYLADGQNGVWVIDVSKPVAPETVAFLDTPGTALDLEDSGVYLFVADGNEGVQIVDILNPKDPAIIGGMVLAGNSLNLDVEWRSAGEGNPGSFFIYVAKGDRGLEILAAGKGVNALVAGLYETPGMAPIVQVVQDGLPLVSSPGKEKSARTVQQTLFDIVVIGILGLLVWLAFFAQFLLPLRSLQDRWAASNRLIRYLFRSHGPAIRIENGRVIKSHGEEDRSGPGVILLDSASAAMLRTKTAFKRGIGPGVVFTEDGEFLHQEAVDLHTQVRPLPPLGPLGDEDPFSPWIKRKEDEKEFQARQDRRKETSGLTRDGVEIVSNILAVVKTKSLQGQGGTRYGFNSSSVRLAVTREGVVPNGLRNIPWHEVPAYLAVDVWREYLGKFTLTELFSTPDLNGNPQSDRLDDGKQQTYTAESETRLEQILRLVSMRLTQAQIPKLDEYGRDCNEMHASREFQILEEMGIQVKDISISRIRLPGTVESQLVHQWLSTWLVRATRERDAVERRRNLAREIGKEKALLEFAESAARNLGEALVDDDGNTIPVDSKQRPGLGASLELLVMGTQQLVARNTTLQKWLLNEKSVLMKLLEWSRR
ncbi:MAG: hypothetical protein ABUK20_06135 [Anaerolineales bacterium]